MGADIDTLRQRIASLEQQMLASKGSPIITPWERDITIKLSEAREALWYLEHPEPAAPDPESVLARVRKRSGLEKAMEDIRERLARAPDRSPAALGYANDLLVLAAEHAALDQESA